MSIINKNRLIVIIFFFSLNLIYSQQLKSYYPPTDVQEIEGIINTIVQGMRQHKANLIFPFFQKPIKQYSSQKLHKNIELFFKNSTSRTEKEKWKDKTPNPALPANWDFTITKPKITVLAGSAIASFKFYWHLNIPVLDPSSNEIFLHPTEKNNEIWKFEKIKGRWSIKSTEIFLNLFI